MTRAGFNGTAPKRRGAVGASQYAAGEILLFPGAPGGLYQLRSGLIRLHAVDHGGYGVTLRYVKPGGYFGEESLSGHQRHYFAEAVTDSAVDTVQVEKLSRQDLLEVATYLAVCSVQLSRALLRMAGKPLRARVAAELLELADSALAGETDAGQPVVYLTHDDLAAAVGSVRETVTKVVGELARSGALKAGYGKIVVLDAAQLAHIAGD